MPTYGTERKRLEYFTEKVYQATVKQGELLMRDKATPPTILTQELRMFRPALYATLLELNAPVYLLALFRVIRDCAEDVKEDKRVSDATLFVTMVTVSGLIGFSAWSDDLLDSAVAALKGWVLVNKPDGTRAWEEEMK